MAILFTALQFFIDLFQLRHQVAQFKKRCFLLVSCCPIFNCCLVASCFYKFDLIIVWIVLCCYCRNLFKCLAFLGRRCYFLLLTIFAILSVDDVLFACESSFIVSGVLLVVSSTMSIGENYIVFVSCSSTFGIGVDSVVSFPPFERSGLVSQDQLL